MKTEKRMFITIAIIAILAGSAGGIIYLTQTANKETLIISTTTSLYDTGLLDAIKEAYEAKHPKIILAFISAGTGIALEQAKNGDADMILVHAPALEKEFMEGGYGVNRKIIAYNFFVIVGPASDPAAINQSSPIEALQKIRNYGETHNESVWVSRDDRSGTNEKEKRLWAIAGINYTKIHDEPWFVSSGTGMGTTLNIANERNLYTLADIGTYLKYRADGLIELESLARDDETLINVYSAMAVNSTMITHAKIDLAMDFIKYLVSEEGQALIENYGKGVYDMPLFYPAVDVIRNHSPIDIAEWIESYAFFDIGGTLYECPPQWQYGNYGLYN